MSFAPAGDSTALGIRDRGTAPVEVDFVTRVGVEATETGVRALDNDAAVGLVNLSEALPLEVTCLTGRGTGICVFRERAREAAVGAKRPPAGVLGRVVLARGCIAGVFGREGVSGTDLEAGRGVRDRDAFDATDWPVCCGLRGWDVDGSDDFGEAGLTDDLMDERDAVEGRLFLGDEAIRVPTGVGVDFLAAVDLSLGGGDLGGSEEPEAASSGATWLVCGLEGGSLTSAADGEAEENTGWASAAITGLGDASFLSLASLTESLGRRRWEVGLSDDVNDCRLFCCSKRPMRLATL